MKKKTSAKVTAPALKVPGQGFVPTHGGDQLSLNNVPQPGHSMTQLFANDYPEGDS